MALTKITGQVVDTTTDLVVGVTTVGGGVSATDGFFSGIVTAVGDASFSGNVSVGGTLTYEDVTNIDAVGLVTARNGIVVGSGITLSKDGDGFFTGVVTATSYYGDGSNLSNITSTTINSNADNRLITGSGTANTLNGETNLTFDGSILNLTTTGTDAALFESTAGGSDGVQLSLRATSASPADDDKLGVLDFSGRDDGNNNTTYAQIRSHSRDVTNGSEDGDITFHTRSDGTFAERFRIGSEGNLALGGSNTAAYANQSHFFIGGTGNIYADTPANSGSSFSLSNNAYLNTSGNWAYRSDGKATNIYSYNGDIGFRMGGTGTAGNTISWSEKLNVANGGDVTVSTGNLVIGTSGKGIDFSATSDASGSGASGQNELLADYEQGDLTFTVTSSNGGSISYSYRTGHYTRIGNVCHVTGDIRFDGSWSGSDGDMYISLPYTSEATGGSVGGGVVFEWNLTSSSYVGLMIKVDNNESVARVTHHDGSNNNTGAFSTSNLGSSRYLKFEFTYQCQ